MRRYQPGEVRDFVQAVYEHQGHVDVLINNAGVIQAGPMEDMTVEDFEEAVATHFWAPLYFTLAVLPEMRKRADGRIVNIASIGGKVAVPHMLPYSASKFALTGLSEGLRAELKGAGIKVTTVSPGLMRTGSHVQAVVKGPVEKEKALFSMVDANPLLSMNVDHSGRQIIAAIRRGDAEIVLGLQYRALAMIHSLMPGTVADVMALTNAVLPKAGGIGTERRKAKDVRSLAPAWTTALADKASLANNELG